MQKVRFYYKKKKHSITILVLQEISISQPFAKLRDNFINWHCDISRFAGMNIDIIVVRPPR